jgi:hypothetical protein
MLKKGSGSGDDDDHDKDRWRKLFDDSKNITTVEDAIFKNLVSLGLKNNIDRILQRII